MAKPGSIYRAFEVNFPAPKSGSLRVWWIPQVPGRPFHWPVANLGHAAMLIDALAAYDDFQLAHKIKPDYSNSGGVEAFINDEWEEWTSEDGEDFDHYRRSTGKVETG